MNKPLRAVLVGLLPRDERANCLGLGYLKAFADARPDLTGGAEVDILDLPSDTQAEGLLTDILRRRPRVVGFVLNLCNIPQVRAAARLLRARAPEVFLILGAQEASLRPEALLEEIGADAVVLGEGEETFAELLGALRRSSPLEEVRGLVLRRGKKFTTTAARRPIQDLSTVPSAYLSGIYPWKAASKTESVLETSRGCPYDCGFCAWPNGVKPRHFPLERVGAEIGAILRRIPTGLIHFSDPDLFLFPERARVIIACIREADPQLRSRWWFNTYLGNMDDELAALCDHPGFIIECGIQTVNPSALKAARRRFDAAKVRRGFSALRRLAPKARVCLQLILGLPGDDLKGFLTSLDWCYGLGAELIHVFPMQLLPGTDFHRRRSEYGVKADALPPYLISSTAAFPAEDLRRARRIVYALQLFLRHRVCWAALEKTRGLGPLPLRAESLTRRLCALGVDMEAAFRRWDEAGSRYLTPLTIGSDPCSSSLIEAAAWEWARSTPAEVA
ncbi:MAG: radical SAM protein [Elusimicrobiota bacterium]